MKSRDARPPFKLENLLHFVGLLIVLIVCVFPFYWMVAASLKSPPDILSSTPQFFFEPTLQNYVDAFGKFDILKSLKNSLFVALVTVVLPDLFDLQCADCRLDLRRSVSQYSERTGRSGDAGRLQLLRHILESRTTSRDARDRRFGDIQFHLLLE